MADIRRGPRGELPRGAFWALTDQALSSLTNFALTLLAARSLHPAEFGGFTLAFSGYLIALGLSRAVSSEPLVVRFSDAPVHAWREGTSRATGSALIVGLVAALAMVVAASITRGATGIALFAIAPFLPGLLLQDAWRFAFFASRSGDRAAANDAIWAMLLATALVVVFVLGHPSIVAFAVAWGAAGTGAALFGLLQARLVPRPHGFLSWWHAQWDLVPRFAAEFAATIGSTQVALYVIGALSGLAAVGAIRAAQVLLGPLNVLFMGAVLFIVPEAARRAQRSLPALLRFGLGVSASLAIGVMLWSGALLLVPTGVGELLLRTAWQAGRTLFVPIALVMAGTGVMSGAVLILRGIADAHRSLRARLLHAPLIVAGAAVGAAVGGGEGAAWGLALATWLAAVAWWTLAGASLESGGPSQRMAPALDLVMSEPRRP